jgi:hypothetical protein
MTPPALPGRFFHGGAPGLRPGELIVPHPPNIVDGCAICAAKARGEQPYVPGLGTVDPLTGRPDRVYLTSDRDYARYYASKYPRGDLYVVEAVGEVEASTEDRFPTWCAPAARVRAVYDRYVQMTPAQRRSLWRRWTAADVEVARRAAAAERGA